MAGFRLNRGQWVIDKDPNSELDYGIRLSSWIPAGDSIPPNPSPTWETSPDLAATAYAYVGGIAYVFLKGGGAVGTFSWARCTWTTAAGRKEQQTLYFLMVDR